MQDESKQEKPDEEVKKRAIKRVAGAAVLALLAAIGLTMITYQKQPEAPVAPVAHPAPTVMPVEPPVSAVSAVQAPAPVPPQVSAVVETPAEPVVPPTVTPPPPPQVVNVPQAPSESSHKAAKPAIMKPTREAEPAVKPMSVTVSPVVEQSGRPRAVQELAQIRETAAKANEAAAKASEVKKPPETPKTAVQAKAVASAPPPLAPATSAPKGYAVQLGVFSNPANAIQMQEKLTQHGIKSYTETKLNVGPFQSKAEADQAMAKVRSLGIGAVVVPVR